MTDITKAAQDAQSISNLRQLLIDAGRSISWQCFGECRAFYEFAPGPVRDPGAVIEDIRAALQDKAGEVPDDVVRYRTIRDGLVYIEPHESGEIYVAGETGVYTKSGDEFDAAIDAIAASKKKG